MRTEHTYMAVQRLVYATACGVYVASDTESWYV